MDDELLLRYERKGEKREKQKENMREGKGKDLIERRGRDKDVEGEK